MSDDVLIRDVALHFRTQLFRANLGIDAKPMEDKTDLMPELWRPSSRTLL